MTENHPAKMYVELTTRCNLHCEMCVKYAPGSCIAEKDMPLRIFRRLMPSLVHIQYLVLNGIGESLLHPDLHEIITIARSHMPEGSVIGLQSNGVLRDRERAQQLITAGLDTLCLSLDSLESSGLKNYTNGEHSFSAVSKAVEALVVTRQSWKRDFKIGLEVVVSKETVGEVPDIVQWAAVNGVDYLVCTHLFPYNKKAEEQCLFNPNPESAVALFDKYYTMMMSQGVIMENHLAPYLKFEKSQGDLHLMQFVEKMQKEACEKNIRLNIVSLLKHRGKNSEDVKKVLDKAARIAEDHSLELFLPPLQAESARLCPFMVQQATFVDIMGNVMPCHYLWHTYAFRMQGDKVQVNPRIFGNIEQQSLENIWQNPEYARFRQEAEMNGYAPCWSCSQGPCPDLVNDTSYANDCFGSCVPCGHCQWSLGGVHCL